MTPRLTGLLVAASVFFVDQLTKWLIINVAILQDRLQIVLLPILNLTWVENRGVSLGMLSADSHAERWLLVALTAAIAAGVLVWLWRERVRGEAAVLGLILGGACGNILDRSRYGYVVDFIDLHFGGFRPFLVFNVADAAITLGVVGLLARSLLGAGRKREQGNA